MTDQSAQAPEASSVMVNIRGVQILPEIALYDGAPPGSPPSEHQEEVLEAGGSKTVRNVSNPTVTAVLPPKGQANGTAVVIAPGGGYYMLAIEDEGLRQARWLAERGITAFVVKYRTIPVAPERFDEVLIPYLSSIVVPGSDVYQIVDSPPAVDDVAAAMKLVRSRAAEWDLDPERIVLMGFSAGAFTALRLATSSDLEQRPDYVATIYPSLDALTVPNDVPPLFGAIALDDDLFKNRGFGLLASWQASGQPFEFHIFERGGHGFGTGTPGTTTMNWIDSFHAWLASHGLTTKSR